MNVARRLQLSSLLSIKHDSNEDDNLSTHRCRQMASVEKLRLWAIRPAKLVNWKISRGTLRKIRIKQGRYRRCTHPEKNKLHEVLNCGEIIACFMQMILVVNCLLIFMNVFTNS